MDFVASLFTDTLPDLEAAVGDILALQFTNLGIDLANAVISPIASFLGPANSGLNSVVTAVAKHLTQVAAHLPDIGAFFYDGFIVVPLQAPAIATGSALDNIVAALTPFDPVGLLNALLAAPIIFTDVLLNGAPFETSSGLLSSQPIPALPGPIAAALMIRNVVAAAIDPPLPSWLSGLAPAAATPRTTAKTVTLNVAPPAAGVKTGVRPTAGSTTPAASGTPGRTPSANVTALLNKPGVGLKHQAGNTAKK